MWEREKRRGVREEKREERGRVKFPYLLFRGHND
jgi:hypothetical protein